MRAGGSEQSTQQAAVSAIRNRVVNEDTQLTPSLLGTAADAWQPRQYREATASVIDSQVKEFIAEALQRAQAILERNRATLEQTAERLLVQERSALPISTRFVLA